MVTMKMFCILPTDNFQNSEFPVNVVMGTLYMAMDFKCFCADTQGQPLW